MNIDFHLDSARQKLYFALPDPMLWSGAAQLAFEMHLRQLMAELEVVRSGLWR